MSFFVVKGEPPDFSKAFSHFLNNLYKLYINASHRRVFFITQFRKSTYSLYLSHFYFFIGLYLPFITFAFYFLIGLYLPFFTYIISNFKGIFNWQFVKSDYDFIVKKADFTNDFPKTYLQDVFDVI